MNLLSKVKEIVTHDGLFHADEVFAIAQLLIAMAKRHPTQPKFKTVERSIYVTFSGDPHTTIKITRDRGLHYENGMMMVDTGREYDPQSLKFDHHQPEFTLKWKDQTPMASAGLIFSFLSKRGMNQEIYTDFVVSCIRGIDGRDNGIYTDKYNLSSAISTFFPVWTPDGEDPTEETINRRFCDALRWAIQFLHSDHYPDNVLALMGEIVNNEKAKAISEVQSEAAVRGMILNLPAGEPVMEMEKFVPWASSRAIKESNPTLKYVIFPSLNKGEWIAQNIRGWDGTPRHQFPERWAGATEIPEIPEAKFCHKGRFLFVATSLEACRKAVEISLSEEND